MTEPTPQEPFSETHLDSPVYRERLMRKLNCLIAVLEVATAKVRRSLEGPGADVERLTRISTNLQSTLDVCLRARSALERREALPQDLPKDLARAAEQAGAAPSARKARTHPPVREFVGEAERCKFQFLPPIGAEELRACDLDDLTRRLQL